MAELADAGDLKSPDPQGSCGFDSHRSHWQIEYRGGGEWREVAGLGSASMKTANRSRIAL